MARVMLMPVEKKGCRPLTQWVKKRKDETVLAVIPSGHSEPRRRWTWKTLIHRITTARRATDGLLVSHTSRFFIGCRLPA